MKPTSGQIRTELLANYDKLIKEQIKAALIKDTLKQDQEITRILNAKNTITIQLMTLK